MIRTILIAITIILVLSGIGYWISGRTSPQDASPVAAPPVTATQGAPSASAGAAPPGEYWAKRCRSEGEDYCEVFQRLSVKENNQRLIEFAVGYPKEAESAQAVVVLPLGIAVGAGIAVVVDAGTPVQAPISTCLPDGCVSTLNLPESFVGSMKSGKTMIVSFLDTAGKRMNIEMPLDGFAKNLAGTKE